MQRTSSIGLCCHYSLTSMLAQYMRQCKQQCTKLLATYAALQVCMAVFNPNMCKELNCQCVLFCCRLLLHNVTETDIELGKDQYLKHGAGALKTRTALTPSSIFYKAAVYYQLHSFEDR